MKKSISIVVALLLLINVFAVSAFAAVPDGNAISLTLTSDKETYAAGETVNVTLSVETTSQVAGLSAGEIEIGYNSAIFDPAKDISGVPSLADYGCTLGDIIATNLDAGGSFVRAGSAAFYADDVTNYGWDSGLYFCVAENYQGITYVDCSAGAKTFVTFPLVIKAGTPDGTYTIGVNKYAFEDGGETYVVSENGAIYGGEGTSYGASADDAAYACGTLTITVGAGGSTGPVEPTVAVKNLDPKVQWRAAGSSDLYIGFEGELSGFTKDQAATVIASISELGIEFSSTDATLATSIKATTNVVYDFTAGDAGVYKFRAVVRKAMTDADAAGTITHNLYARAFVKIGDKAPITASDIISTTIHDEYTEGVNNKMLTLAENLAAK